MPAPSRRFVLLSRVLHWVMAVLVLAMLGIGVSMVASLGSYHALVELHRPLGIAILVLVVVRFANRLLNPPPPFPDTMPRAERVLATVSEFTMYALMFLLPLVGWGMLSAAHYPIVMFGAWHLPAILPHDLMLYAVLRATHTVLAYVFFLLFVGHFGAILFHTLIVRDGLLDRMALWRVRGPKEPADAPPALEAR
jgi:cytochrome b561